jgi:DNA polymerase-1
MSLNLVIDTNYLCYRALYTTGQLSHEGKGTGTIYGVLVALDTLRERFDPDRVLFAFDRGYGKRLEVFPEYKQHRRKNNEQLSDVEFHDLIDFRDQVDLLRRRVLKGLGYRNVFWQKGYEADDVIASLVTDLVEEDENEQMIIVSADQDLWQLLSWGRTTCYNPQTRVTMTAEKLLKDYGASPMQWGRAKALAGCDGDGVPGIKGVGMKTACKWEAGKLKRDSVAWRRISEGMGIMTRNYQLVKLPFPGVESFEIREDRLTAERRRKVFDFQERRPKGVK